VIIGEAIAKFGVVDLVVIFRGMDGSEMNSRSDKAVGVLVFVVGT